MLNTKEDIIEDFSKKIDNITDAEYQVYMLLKIVIIVLSIFRN